MDHAAMDKAMRNALEYQIQILKQELADTKNFYEDQYLLADALAKTLIKLMADFTLENIEDAKSILEIWSRNHNANE